MRSLSSFTITDPQCDRYHTSRLIRWWDQDRLSTARVMVVGAGALGNEVLKNLALLGVGDLFIVDIDDVEMSNLSRSVLFRAKDVGRPKAEVAAERIRGLNPDVKTHSFHADIVRDVGLGIFRRMDVVIGCIDNREARWAVNRACWRVGKPWVDGGLDVLSGSVKVFVPPDGACYECGLTEQDRLVMNLRNRCPGVSAHGVLLGRMPTTVTSAAVVAGVQVQETLKLLHGLPVPGGSIFIYDGASTRMWGSRLALRAACPAHRRLAPIVELDRGARSLTLAGLLAEARRLLGEGAFVSLDRQVNLQWTCSECGAVEGALVPYRVPGPVLSGCPVCGGARFPMVRHTFRCGMLGLGLSLADAGVPPLHIIAARNGAHSVYLELTADAPRVFGNWAENQDL